METPVAAATLEGMLEGFQGTTTNSRARRAMERAVESSPLAAACETLTIPLCACVWSYSH